MNIIINLKGSNDLVLVKTQSLSLTVLLCLYVIFAFSINPFMNDFIGMSIEVTDQNNEGVFSSLSRNFEQTVQEINSGDEKRSPSNSIGSNSTATGDLEKKNQTDVNRQN